MILKDWIRLALPCLLALVCSYLPGQSIFDNPTIFTEENGLLDNYITAIKLDRQNFTWIGSTKGLARFDGKSFKYFLHDPEDPHSIAHNQALAIYQDHKDRLWIGTYYGLSLYREATQDFKNYRNSDIASQNRLPFSRINAIIEDREQQLWVGLNEAGLAKYDEVLDTFLGIGFAYYDPRNNRFDEAFYNKPKEGKIYGADFIDPQGRVWARSDHGLYIFDPLTNQFHSHYFPVLNPDFGYNSRALVESLDGNQLYIAPDRSEGIQIFDRTTQTWDLVRISARDANEYGVLDVQDMIRLQDGRIIIGGNNEIWTRADFPL